MLINCFYHSEQSEELFADRDLQSLNCLAFGLQIRMSATAKDFSLRSK